ncbi:MFS transporter [Streptomyces sp. NPDC101150]|uniref:MFS transporter n=1 Tax=Streptomyces sp. NPDC101150 TaxID=3366114 RepID=UPI00380A24BA
MTETGALELTPPAGSGPSAGGGRRATPAAAVLISLVLVELASGVTQGFLGPLLKGLTATLHVTVAELNWISVANLLASVAFTPVLSRLGDLHGHRRVLRWNLGIVLLGSVLVGVSRSFGLLLAGSVLQGAFAGFFPLLVGIVRNRRTAAENRRGISFMVASLVTGLALGTVCSGLIAQYVARPTAALWVPALAVTIAMAVTWPLLPESEARPDGRADWAGAALLCTGLVAIMLGLGQGGAPGWAWTSPKTLGSLVGGLVVTGVWVLVELRTADPVMDVRLFRRRSVVVVALVTLTFSSCMLGLLVASPVFLSTSRAEAGYGLGLSPLMTAFALLPNMLALVLGALIAPSVAGRISDRLTLVTGSLLMAAGNLATFAWHRTLPPYLVFTAVVGLGSGLLQHATRTLAVEAVPRHQTSVGSGINELLINVGGSLGAAVVLSVFAAQTAAGRPLPAVTAYTHSWAICAAVSLAGALIALLYRRPGHTPDGPGSR